MIEHVAKLEQDVLSAMGVIEISTRGLGCDASGVVRRVGSAVTELKPGDRVLTVSAGSYATRLQRPALAFTKIPDSVTFADAATMPTVYMTVIHSLLNLCNLQKGEVSNYKAKIYQGVMLT